MDHHLLIRHRERERDLYGSCERNEEAAARHRRGDPGESEEEKSPGDPEGTIIICTIISF
jgi:hypothetical protein